MSVTLYKDYTKLETSVENSRWQRKLSTGDWAEGRGGANTNCNDVYFKPSLASRNPDCCGDLGRIEVDASVGRMDSDRGPTGSIRTAHPQVLSCC